MPDHSDRQKIKRNLRDQNERFFTDLSKHRNRLVEKSSRVRIACPVDVDIYDPDGNLVLTLTDGSEQQYYEDYGNFYVVNEDGEFQKILEFGIEGYTYKIRGNETGTMNVTVSQDQEDGSTRQYSSEDIPITETSVFSGTEEKSIPKLTAIENEQSADVPLSEEMIVPVTSVTLDQSEITLNKDETTGDAFSNCRAGKCHL